MTYFKFKFFSFPDSVFYQYSVFEAKVPTIDRQTSAPGLNCSGQPPTDGEHVAEPASNLPMRVAEMSLPVTYRRASLSPQARLPTRVAEPSSHLPTRRVAEPSSHLPTRVAEPSSHLPTDARR